MSLETQKQGELWPSFCGASSYAMAIIASENLYLKWANAYFEELFGISSTCPTPIDIVRLFHDSSERELVTALIQTASNTVPVECECPPPSLAKESHSSYHALFTPIEGRSEILLLLSETGAAKKTTAHSPIHAHVSSRFTQPATPPHLVVQEPVNAFRETQNSKTSASQNNCESVNVIENKNFDHSPCTIDELKAIQQRLQQANENLERRVAERTQSLLDYQEELRAMVTELALAEQRERRRLATELHDFLAQLLVACRMKAASIKRTIRSQNAAGLLDEVDEMLEQSIAYTRTLIAELSPSVLYEAGLVPAIKWLGEQMRRRGLQVEILHDGHSISLPDDIAVAVFQSVRELLFNVVRHANVNTARVHVTSTTRALTLVVSDEGTGFDPSSIAGAATTGKYGLCSIRERFQAIGGSLAIESTPGKGVRASLRIPLQPCKDEHPLHPSSLTPYSGAPNPQSERHAINLILADDHAMIRTALRNLLENYSDLQVVGEAADGEEALLMTHTLHPDAVIMDVNMPKMNGIEATRRIHQELPGVVIIGLSVYDDIEVAASMREAGATAYLAKGSPPEELYRTIRNAKPLEQLYFAE